MILLEYEAKALLNAYGIPIAKGQLYYAGYKPFTYPVVVKSQVPTGGRGKLGGIKIATNKNEFTTYVDEIKALNIKGFTPKNLYIETALDVAQEYYLSLTINRETSQVQLTAHKEGGINIEEQQKDSFLQLPIPYKNPNFNTLGEQLAEYLGLESQVFTLQDMLQNLYKAFMENDATLIEINPLILTITGQLIAGDAKIELDDGARFRHNWDYETPVQDANFIVLNPKGDVALLANGAGLAMATVDSIYASGLIPANFLDIGGGANEEKVIAAFKDIMAFPSVKAIIINIFGGITRCDEIAKAIIHAKNNVPGLPPLFIRLEGNNYDQAKTLLDQNDILLLPTLNACIDAAKKEVKQHAR